MKRDYQLYTDFELHGWGLNMYKRLAKCLDHPRHLGILSDTNGIVITPTENVRRAVMQSLRKGDK